MNCNTSIIINSDHWFRIGLKLTELNKAVNWEHLTFYNLSIKNEKCLVIK